MSAFPAVVFESATATEPVASTFELPEDLEFMLGPKGGPLFSPAVYAPGAKRGNAGVSYITALTLDLDHATESSFEALLARLRDLGLEHAWYHSHSHGTPEKPFAARLIVPFDVPVPTPTDAAWRKVWTASVKELGAEALVDASRSDRAGMYYLPRKPSPDAAHRAGYCPGAVRYTAPAPAAPRAAQRHAAPATAPEQVTVAELRERLTRCASKQAKRVGRGDAPSPPPGPKRAADDPPRRQAWFAVTGALTRIAPLGTSLETLEEVLRPAWYSEQIDSPEDFTPWETIQENLSRNHAKATAEKEAERQSQETMLARMRKTVEAVDAAAAVPTTPPEGLPEIRVDTGVPETLITDSIIAALSDSPRVYHRGGELVLVGGSIHPVTRYSLIDEISRRCRLVLAPRLGEEPKPARCSERTAAIIMSLREWPSVREVVEVRRCSFLSPTGRVVDVEGYDPETKCVLRPTVEHEPVVAEPTREQASGALRALEALVCDFPFESPAHLSGWLALVLTLVARPALKQVPLFMIDAASSGSGKTLLVDLAAVIAAGTTATRSAWSANVDEQRKAVLATLRDGTALALIDNLPNGGNLGSHVLDNLLSSETYSDRLLGASAMLTLPARTVWAATGNNLSIAGDMQRRVVPVRLASTVDDPSARVGFRLPRIIDSVFDMRGALLRDALTVLRGYFAAGRPPMPPEWRPWGHPFDGWSDLIRGALAWLGADDPAEARRGVQMSAESGSETLTEVLGLLGGTDKWRSTKDLMTGQLGRALQACLAEKQGEELSVKAVGRRLVALRQRVLGGKRLVSKKDKAAEVLLWRVEKVTP